MIENQKIRPDKVIGPLGEPLTLDDLPSPKTKRWVVRRKAEVVAAVNGGLLTIDEVLERYGLTLEEFAGWQRAVDRSGMQGLRVTRIQHYRDLYERQLKYRPIHTRDGSRFAHDNRNKLTPPCVTTAQSPRGAFKQE